MLLTTLIIQVQLYTDLKRYHPASSVSASHFQQLLSSGAQSAVLQQKKSYLSLNC